MTEKRWLYFALGVTTVISIGAVTNQLVPLAPSGVAVGDTGITFPDGTVQTTAAAETASAARASALWKCSLYMSDGQSIGECAFPQVPQGKILVVESVSGLMYFP